MYREEKKGIYELSGLPLTKVSHTPEGLCNIPQTQRSLAGTICGRLLRSAAGTAFERGRPVAIPRRNF
jgi:hypothetical protein